MTREVADATTAILTGVIDGSGSRTGKDMSLGRDAAGKTGTTDSNAAVWFAGFTPISRLPSGQVTHAVASSTRWTT